MTISYRQGSDVPRLKILFKHLTFPWDRDLNLVGLPPEHTPFHCTALPEIRGAGATGPSDWAACISPLGMFHEPEGEGPLEKGMFMHQLK